MSLLRFFVTVVVAVPLFLAVGWPHPWWTTFLIAVVAIAAGYGAEAVVKRGGKPPDPQAAEATPTDRRWELNMLLKKAIAAEERGEYDQAYALFEQVLRKADRQEDAELARRHMQDLTSKRSTPEDA
jgi:hypothetical protein